MNCIWFKSVGCGAHRHYYTLWCSSSYIKTDGHCLRLSCKLVHKASTVTFSGTHIAWVINRQQPNQNKKKEKKKYLPPMPILLTRKGKLKQVLPLQRWQHWIWSCSTLSLQPGFGTIWLSVVYSFQETSERNSCHMWWRNSSCYGKIVLRTESM